MRVFFVNKTKYSLPVGQFWFFTLVKISVSEVIYVRFCNFS